MVRCSGLHANAHRGKVRKADRVPIVLGTIKKALPRSPLNLPG